MHFFECRLISKIDRHAHRLTLDRVNRRNKDEVFVDVRDNTLYRNDFADHILIVEDLINCELNSAVFVSADFHSAGLEIQRVALDVGRIVDRLQLYVLNVFGNFGHIKHHLSGAFGTYAVAEVSEVKRGIIVECFCEAHARSVIRKADGEGLCFFIHSNVRDDR